MRWIAAAIVLLLAAAPAIAAQPRPERDCRDDDGVDRCDPARQQQARTMFGVRPIEAHRDAGDQVRRAFFVDGYGNDVVAIAFVRPRGGEPQMSVHFRREAGAPARPPLRAPVPQEAWELLIERSAHFDLAPVRPPEPSDPELITMCVHGWVYTVEASDPPRFEGATGTIRRRTENGCTNGLAEAYADEIERLALSVSGPCARLDPRQYRREASQLAACALLAGDRLAAADAMNSAEPLFRIEGADDLGAIRSLFEARATVDWNGERSGAGNDAAARLWVARSVEAGRGSFFVDTVAGESAGRVRLAGGFARWLRVPGQSEEVVEIAPATLIWVRDGRDFYIESATVGPFARRPQR